MQVIQIEDFTAEVLSAADLSSSFDVALVFSTKYEAHSVLDGWKTWQEWKTLYFGFHRDLPPAAAAHILGGEVRFKEERRGQWIAVIEIDRPDVENAELRMEKK